MNTWRPAAAYVGRHRRPSSSRPVAPLAVALSPIEAMLEGTFTALRHMGATPIPLDEDGNPAPLMGPWDDTRSPDEAWALADIDTDDIRVGRALAVTR